MASVNFYIISFSKNYTNISKLERLFINDIQKYEGHIIIGDDELQHFKSIIKLKIDNLINTHREGKCTKPRILIDDMSNDDIIFIHVGSIIINISKLKTHAVILTLNFTTPFQIELSRLKSELNK